MKNIFISYSWDSEEHQQWVKKFADELEVYEEFHVTLDQYDLDTTTDKNRFMEEAVYDSDLIIVVCTENYAKKADNRKGGVGIETLLATAKHYEESKKHGKSNIIAITRGNREKSIPRYLKGKFSIQFNDDSFEKNISELIDELKNYIFRKSNRPEKSKSLSRKKLPFYDFNKVEDILALLYKNRTQINKAIDFSGNKKIKYEYWEARHVIDSQYFLILFNNINIYQTIERFVHDNPNIPKKLAVLRVDKGKQGYIEQQFKKLSVNVEITEFKIDDLVWDECIDQEWKRENNVLEEEFFIDQRIYSDNINESLSMGLALDYLTNNFLQNNTPILMLFASGGVGKSTLCYSVNNKINENAHKKAILIQSENIRDNIDKNVSKNYRIENIYQLYDIYTRLVSNTKSLLNEKQFDLGVLSGRIILIIDGLDELLSLFQESFDLAKFLDSLLQLNSHMGYSKIIITSRLNVLNNNLHISNDENIEIAYLKGFEEDIWKKYLKRRFSEKLESKELVSKTKQILNNIQNKNKDNNVLPFFLDLICGVVEHEKIANEFIVDTISSDYISNNENIDYLIHAILKREITRQKFDVSLSILVDLFKEISIKYGDRFTKDNLKNLISIYFDTSDSEEIYRKVLLNPLLTNSSDKKVVKFKYDFLANYFAVLYLLENLTIDYKTLNVGKDLIIQLSKLYDGTHIVLSEVVKYFKNDKQNCLIKCSVLIKSLISQMQKSENATNNYKRAISTIMYLVQNIHGNTISKDIRREIINKLFKEDKINHMYIWGDFFPIDFSNLEIWSSEFHNYKSFCKSTFSNTKFYHSSFSDIPINGSCSDLTTCIFDRCNLGTLSSVISQQEDKLLGKQKNLEDDLKKFFRNFMQRGNFIYKDYKNLTIPNSLTKNPKKFIDSLMESILEQETVKLNKSYGVKKSFQKDVNSLIKDNHLSPKLKNAITKIT